MIQQTAPFRILCRAIQRAERLTLLEGLPHPTWEHTAFSHELASNAVRDVLGSAFYDEVHALSAEDDAAIRSVFAHERSFQFSPDEGKGKRCGGFHADFAIEFAHEAQAGAALICFGCREIKTLLQAHRWHHDLLPDANDALSRVLLTHRYKRPIPAPPRPEPTPAELSGAKVLDAVGAILADLEAYHLRVGRYPSALFRRQSEGQPLSVIHYQALSGGRDFWLVCSHPERDGEIVFRASSIARRVRPLGGR